MYPEALKSICAIEAEAREAKLLAQQRAQEMLDESKRTGQEAIASTLARAESEIAHLRRLSNQKAAEQALELASTTANRQATLRARAERLLDTAAALIVERIINTK